MRRFLFAAACWATVGLVGARADVSYRYITDKTRYEGAPGTIVPVNLILQETVTGTSISKIFADGGLFGAGVILNSPGGIIYGQSATQPADFKISGNALLNPAGFGVQASPGGPIAPTQVDNATAGTFGPSSALHSGLIINADIGQGPIPTKGTAAVNTYLLGTVNIKIGTGDQTLTVTPYSGSNNTITMLSTDLDFGTQQANGYTGASTPIGGLYSFTVGQVIPEPSSMALCGLVACGMGYAGYRRRNNKSAEPVTVG
jgi:hypothetical protein